MNRVRTVVASLLDWVSYRTADWADAVRPVRLIPSGVTIEEVGPSSPILIKDMGTFNAMFGEVEKKG